MFVLIDVCCNDLPIASAMLMKRLAKSVSKMGSGPFVVVNISEKHRLEWLSQGQPLPKLTYSSRLVSSELESIHKVIWSRQQEPKLNFSGQVQVEWHLAGRGKRHGIMIMWHKWKLLLASLQPGEKSMEATLADFLKSQDDLVREAALALPHQFSQCTWSRGPLRYSFSPAARYPADHPKASRLSLSDMSRRTRNLLCLLHCVPYEPWTSRAVSKPDQITPSRNAFPS